MPGTPIYDEMCAARLIGSHLDLTRRRRVDVGALVTRASDRPGPGRHHLITDPNRRSTVTEPEYDPTPDESATEPHRPVDPDVTEEPAPPGNPGQEPAPAEELDDVAPSAGSAT